MTPVRGYTALLSVLILAAVLFSATIATDTVAYLVHMDVREEMTYRQSRATARACAVLTVQALTLDASRFNTDVPLSFTIHDLGVCRILSVHVQDSVAEVLVQGTSGTSISRVTATATKKLDGTGFEIDSWSED